MQSFRLWQAVCFCFVPIACLYQLCWGIYFSKVPSQFWVSGAFNQALLLKHSGEIALYMLMLWCVVTKTVANTKLGKLLICILLVSVSMYTLVLLINVCIFNIL
ncbi:hypothetical protein N483_14325 [Pseudoalteromonas luteoviolacea NCIMB 1944]|nr:hypothetical protein N483_14325 [Pseudoalteromonas luteoviolacea NCIMB 1944]